MNHPEVTSTNHPSDETLAAFVDNRLDAPSRKIIIDHIATCDDCRADWQAICEFNALSDDRPDNVKQGNFHRGRWVPLSAIAAAIALGFLLWPFVQTYRNRDALIKASAARKDRPSLARLSGAHPYKPATPTLRGPKDPLSDNDEKVYRAAGGVAESASKHPTVENLRQLAALQFLLENWDAAVAAGEKALQADTGLQDVRAAIATSTNAPLLIDLGAAYYARGRTHNDPGDDFRMGLEASKRAWELSKSPEALWNYAAVLEASGLTAAARAKWEEYLRLDGDSPWAKEIHGRLSPDATGDAGWTEDKAAALSRSLLESRQTNVRALVVRYPKESRTFGEEYLLGTWGDRPNDPTLRAAELLGTVIAEATKDRLLIDAVRAIRSAPTLQVQLAKAHATYRTARAASTKQPSSALADYDAVAAAFDAAQSPFAALVRLRAAGCKQRQMDFAAALRHLDEIGDFESLARRGYVALAADAEWTRGSIYVDQGLHDLALNSFERALQWFRGVGDRTSEADVRARAAQAADMMGDHVVANYHRTEALRLYERSSLKTRQSILMEAGLSLSLNGWGYSADEMFTQLVGTGRQSGDEFIVCAGLLWRGLNYARRREPERARRDVDESMAYCDAIRDPVARARARENQAVVESMVAADTPYAMKRLDDAIAVAERTGSLFRRAVLYAQRSRRNLEQGNVQAARADAVRATDDLEDQILRVKQAEFRSSWVNAVRQLIDVRVDAELASDDVAAAFSTVEWQRLHTAGSAASEQTATPSIRDVQRTLRPDAAVLIFYAGEERLTTFVVRSSAVDARVVQVGSAVLARETAALRDAVDEENATGTENAARALHKILIEPVAPLLAGARTLIVIPDRAVALLPFVLLRASDGRRVLDDFMVMTVPSAASLIRSERCSMQPFERALIVGGARRLKDGEVAIADPAKEIEVIGSLYGHVQKLLGTDATPETFLDSATEADIVQYIGHAVASPSQPRLSALVLSGGEGDPTRRVYAHQIPTRDWRRVRLLILAACSTARRDVAARPFGSLAQTFLEAGVQSVIGTLWDVEDVASHIAAVRIHRAVRQGAMPGDAVRRMQLSMARDPLPALRSPKAWAAWSVVGGCDGQIGQ